MIRLTVLGACDGRSEQRRSISCLLNDTILVVDAGSAASALSIESQLGVQDLLLSHAHIDHVAELCFLLNNHSLAATNRSGSGV